MKRFACLAIPFALAACGDNNSVTAPIDASTTDPDAASIDAASIDARLIDATEIDAVSIDAAPVQTFSGTISVVEARLRNMGGAGIDGHGIQIGVSFLDNLTAVPPIDMTAGATTTSGCFVWRYNAAQLPGLIGTDQGPVQINVVSTTTPSGGNPSVIDPPFPTCVFSPTAGYICPDTGSSGAGGVLTMMSAGTSTFTIVAGGGTGATFGDEDIGRYLRLGGTGTALDTAFPIVARASATTVVIAGTGTTLTLPAAATFTTLAGVGPVPDLAAGAPRSFLPDTAIAEATKTGGTQVDNFANRTLALGGPSVGDDFTLGTAASASTPAIPKVLPTAIPTDGSEFVVGCDSSATCMGTGVGAGSVGSLINIVTTNATLGASPFDFPTGTSRTQIRCVSLSSNEVRVPAAISAHLRRSESGANRIQTTFIRGNFGPIGDTTPPTATTNFLGGHAEVGFTNVP